MRKLVFLFFTLIIFLLGQDLFGQKIFREGYVVKKTGESLNGIIEYSMNQDIPPVCNFKRFDIARNIIYTPDDIMAFGYRNGNRYETRELDNKKSFFEVIVSGKIILYSKGSKFYIDKDHLGFVELKNGKVTYPVNGEKAEFKSLPEFLNVLTEGKAGTISDRFNLKKEIVQLIIAYNKESGTSYYVFNRKISEKQLNLEVLKSEANKNKFGILSGINLYTLHLIYNRDFSGLNTNIFLPAPESKISPVIGFTYDRILFRKTDRFSLRLDLLYTKQNFYHYREANNTIGGITRDDAFFNFSGIKIPVLLQYSFTGSRLVPYINAGAAYQYIITNNYNHTAEAEDMFHTINTSEDNNFRFNTGEITFVGGIGLRTRLINNINFHLIGRVESGSGLFINSMPNLTNYVKKNPYVQSSIQSSIILGITF